MNILHDPQVKFWLDGSLGLMVGAYVVIMLYVWRKEKDQGDE